MVNLDLIVSFIFVIINSNEKVNEILIKNFIYEY